MAQHILTVKELIQSLQEHDPRAEVFVTLTNRTSRGAYLAQTTETFPVVFASSYPEDFKPDDTPDVIIGINLGDHPEI